MARWEGAEVACRTSHVADGSAAAPPRGFFSGSSTTSRNLPAGFLFEFLFSISSMSDSPTTKPSPTVVLTTCSTAIVHISSLYSWQACPILAKPLLAAVTNARAVVKKKAPSSSGRRSGVVGSTSIASGEAQTTRLGAAAIFVLLCHPCNLE